MRYVDNIRGYVDLLEWVATGGSGSGGVALELSSALAPRLEKAPQQSARLLGTHPAEHIHPMREPRLARQIEDAAAGAAPSGPRRRTPGARAAH